MNYSEKASRFLELSGIDNPSGYQKTQISELRRKLATLGLDPQHPKGLTYRALVYDNRKLIEKFLNLSASKKDTAGLGYQLKNLGIDINRPQELRRILGEIKVAAKKVEQQKNPAYTVGLGRQGADADLDQEFDEMDGEEMVEEANQLAFGTT